MSIPRYAREYSREWKRYDRFLRLRWSINEAPDRFILERKTRYLTFPDDVVLGTDRAVRYKDGYRRVYIVAPNELRWVLDSLRLHDIQRVGGAAGLSRQLLEAEEKAEELLNRRNRAEMEAVSGDVYEEFAWSEGRRISMAPGTRDIRHGRKKYVN